jgi:hypothetical protein
MGLFAPKKPKRQTGQQSLDAAVAAVNAWAGVITEAQLRQAEASGAEVFRRADCVIVRTEIPGGWRLETYEIEGNGRYRMGR